MEDLVSVIIPTYKGSDKLSRAIDSVLLQTYKNIELIIVDDNSPDWEERKKTQDVVEQYKNKNIKYIKHCKNKNGAAARNTGMKNSSGEFITFLDDDDFLFPKRVEKSVEYLLNREEYDCVYCSVVFAHNNKMECMLEANKPIYIKDILLNEMTIGTGSNIFFRRNVISYVNGFDESFKRHQDLEFMIRVMRHCKVGNLNENLIVRSMNNTNNTPEYIDLKDIKHRYFEKFELEINELTFDEKIMFYNKHYTTLVYSSFSSGNIDYINEALLSLNKIRELGNIEKAYFEVIEVNNIGYGIIVRNLDITNDSTIQNDALQLDEVEFISRYL